MSIRRVQKLSEQGPRGSLAYQKATCIARAYGLKANTKPVVGISGDGPKGGVSSWLNPALAPPLDPLKYGTPIKKIERDINGGKLQWASRLITLRRVLYQRLLQPC